MAAKKGGRRAGKNKVKETKRFTKLRWALAVCAVLALGVGAMYVNACVVHVRRAEVFLDDLPQSFDGTKILFASDFDLCGTNTFEDADRLFEQLQALEPDMLLLGGDYVSPSLIDRLNGVDAADYMPTRIKFFDMLADFQAPLGKYAVSGDNDGDAQSLNMGMMRSGVRLVDGGAMQITKNQDSIVLVGIGEQTEDVSSIGRELNKNQCVIALMHRPEKAVALRITDARDGGQWVDLSLAGHTHGGQITIAGRSALSLGAPAERSPDGWSRDGGLMLVTEGVGCESVNLRLGSQAEVWLITLRTK